MIRRLVLLSAVLLLGACARTPIIPIGSAELPEQVELAEVPFFPQAAYQCGPAALATMLVQRGVNTGPDQLVERVYLPERKGSLQVEMVAAARAHDLLVYPVEPRLEALLTEVAAGNPVLVLQNLAFDRWPQWHFAVVVGYDLTTQTIVLRSGTTRRWIGSFRQFERSWAKGDRWAMVTVMPDQLPQTAKETLWLKAANDLEQTGHIDAAQQAYETAAKRWSGGLSWFALGNSWYAQGDKRAAERALRTSVQRDETFAAGWFNLSQVLAERGCTAQSSRARACAVKLAPEDERFTAELPAVQGDEMAACEAPPPCPVH
ncbi:PA2778 family cysteine peptidase [Pseudomonas stutzeri]|uniref:PA2778 family cysteine peptidase n=1 Tax=Stutzerimonas stutzeri TaxID=316 RepID=UPI00210C34C8|nr:PA2778 family cysteine peptidase [Stutzerimonas stutzeri]MCQ4313364.1 PA2778 family cysteine peptidase [Stutzerimonas stutzeri]